ncbi:MAG: hypothetical protein R3C32_10700 [Chloroflexota bacterium]
MGGTSVGWATRVTDPAPRPAAGRDHDARAGHGDGRRRSDRGAGEPHLPARAGQGRIDATATIRFTNRIPVQRSGNRIRRIYIDRWGPIAIPADATRLRVRPRSVKVQRIPTGTPFDNLVFSFPRIFNGGSVSFTVTWVIRGDGTAVTGTVVTAAYSHFCWTGQLTDSGPITFVAASAGGGDPGRDDPDEPIGGSAAAERRGRRPRHLLCLHRRLRPIAARASRPDEPARPLR